MPQPPRRAEPGPPPRAQHNNPAAPGGPRTPRLSPPMTPGVRDGGRCTVGAGGRGGAMGTRTGSARVPTPGVTAADRPAVQAPVANARRHGGDSEPERLCTEAPPPPPDVLCY